MNSHYPNISNYPNTLLFEHVLLQRRRYVRSYMIQFKFNSGRHLHNVLTLSIHERVLPTVTINTIVLPGWSPSLNLYDSSSVEIKDARQTHQTIEKMFNFQTIYKYIYIYIFLLNKVDKFFESLHYIYIGYPKKLDFRLIEKWVAHSSSSSSHQMVVKLNRPATDFLIKPEDASRKMGAPAPSKLPLKLRGFNSRQPSTLMNNALFTLKRISSRNFADYS